LGHRIDVEEIVPHEVKAVAERMMDAVEEIFDDCVVVDPMVVVARTEIQS
jgi:hypothetical protein